MKLPLLIALAGLSALCAAQGAPTGHVATPEVSLAYWALSSAGTAHAATPLIAVNGGPGLSHVYMIQNDLWQRISRAREVVLYDQRGTGASPLLKPDASQSMASQVADLDAIREHLGFAKIDLLGDSYGGMLAMAYTAAHPERVRKLILSDSAAPAWKDIVHLFPQVFPDKLEAEPKAADPAHPTTAEQNEGLRRHFGMIFYSPEKRDAYMSSIKNLGLAPGIGGAVWAANAQLDLTSALPKFTCPTLVINGRYDMNVAPLTAWRMYKAIPGAKIEFFEKSGHLPSYEEPDKYVRVVEAFLDAK